MHQIPFGGRTPPGTPGRTYSAPQTPSRINGSLYNSKGVWEVSGGRMEGRRGRGREKDG